MKARKKPTRGMKPRENHRNGFLPFRGAMVAKTAPMIKPRKSHGKRTPMRDGAGGGALCACAIITVLTI